MMLIALNQSWHKSFLETFVATGDLLSATNLPSATQSSVSNTIFCQQHNLLSATWSFVSNTIFCQQHNLLSATRSSDCNTIFCWQHNLPSQFNCLSFIFFSFPFQSAGLSMIALGHTRLIYERVCLVKLKNFLWRHHAHPNSVYKNSND